jgi:hypothetical protein
MYREAAMTTSTEIILVLAIAVSVLVGILVFQRQKTEKLKSRFGPEYDRIVDKEGSPRRAEAVLDARQKRVDKFQLRPLSREECDRFADEWHTVQERFVDDPRRAIAEADHLINEALRSRGYPMADFEQQAADISVEHPGVVEDYRTAHEIALRDRKGYASTEDLRLAMQHYRSLFENVLDTKLVHREDVRR